MCTGIEVAAIIGATAAVGGAVTQNNASKAAESAQKKATNIDNARESMRTQRQKQKLIAQLRVQQAAQLAQGVSSGAQQSSSLFGAQQSTLSQAGEASVFSGVNSAMSRASAGYQSTAASAINRGNSQAAVFGAVVSTAAPFASNTDLTTRVFGAE